MIHWGATGSFSSWKGKTQRREVTGPRSHSSRVRARTKALGHPIWIFFQVLGENSSWPTFDTIARQSQIKVYSLCLCWGPSSRRHDHQPTHELDPSNRRLLIPSPALGMWVLPAFPSPRGCPSIAVWCGGHRDSICDGTQLRLL